MSPLAPLQHVIPHHHRGPLIHSQATPNIQTTTAILLRHQNPPATAPVSARNVAWIPSQRLFAIQPRPVQPPAIIHVVNTQPIVPARVVPVVQGPQLQHNTQNDWKRTALIIIVVIAAIAFVAIACAFMLEVLALSAFIAAGAATATVGIGCGIAQTPIVPRVQFASYQVF